MKVIVIGAGQWGRNLVRTFHELGALAAVAETSDELRANLEAQYPEIPLFSRVQDALEQVSADGVVIATPAHTHYEIAVEALQSGKDVFIEKPITLSSNEASKLVSLAGEQNRILMVGHLLLYQPGIQKVKEMLLTGAIGKLRAIHQERMKLGRVRSVENVLWSFGVHDLAVILYLSGQSPVKVEAVGQRILQSEVEDDIHVHMEFEQGLTAHLHVSWLWPEQRRKLVLIGEQGMLVFNEEDQQVILHKKTVGTDLMHIDGGAEVVYQGHQPPLTLECKHFLECIRDRKQPLSDGANGLEVVRLIEEANKKLAKTSSPVPDYYAHPTATIDEGATIGKGTKIWHYSHVMSGAVIGQKCNLGQNVYVANRVSIGQNVKIQNNVSVYDGVILEDDVFCGPSMVFTNVKTPRSAFPVDPNADYFTTRVKQGASIGANATIVCGTTLGRSSMIAAGAVVTKDVPDFALVAGVPAVQIGWVCECGARLDIVDDLAACSCGRRYKFFDGFLAKT